MIQRYEIGSNCHGGTLWENDSGCVVYYDDHEAAISEARKQERERCVAEISGVARDWKVVGDYGKAGAAEYLIEQLKKGLPQ